MIWGNIEKTKTATTTISTALNFFNVGQKKNGFSFVTVRFACFATFKRISSGSIFKDKLSILGVAVLLLVPNHIRKRTLRLSNTLDQLIDQFCCRTIVKIDGISYFLLDRESFEVVSPEFEGFMKAWFEPRKNDVVVDVGAHIGKYALSSAKVVGNEGTVLAVEPHPINYRTLVRNIELNKIRNVIPVNLAAWNMDTKLKFFVAKSTAQHSIKTNAGLGSFEVEARALDHVLSAYDRIDWIKIDVEGAEYETLCGLEQVISNCRPKILIEVFSKNADKVKGFFKNQEYQLVCIARFLISSGESCFYFACMPEEKSQPTKQKTGCFQQQ
jgi:FkbM family methyltransferase